MEVLLNTKQYLPLVQPRARRWWMGARKQFRCVLPLIATSASFTAKKTARPTVQTSRDGRPTDHSWHSERSTQTSVNKAGLSSLFDRKSHVTDHDFTGLNMKANHFQLLDGKSRLFAYRKKIYAYRYRSVDRRFDNHWYSYHRHGRRKGGRGGPWFHWILKLASKKGCFFSFEWEKTNFTIFAHPLEKFWKNPLVLPPGKNLSDAHDHRYCHCWDKNTKVMLLLSHPFHFRCMCPKTGRLASFILIRV